MHHFFQSTIILILAAWTTLLSPCIAGAERTAIRFAPLPMENRESIVLQFRPMIDFLQKKLGLPIEFVFCEDYGQILDKFTAGAIDLAYLGPLPYVALRAQDPQAEPLLHFKEANGQPRYTCAVIALADAHLNLRALADRRIALTQPLSTCGYLAVEGLLRQQGGSLAQNSYRYLDKHDAVALAVVRGEFDAGGAKTAIVKKYAHLGLSVVAETPPFPGFGLIANRATLPEHAIKATQDALTRLDPAGADRELLADWGEFVRYGSIVASDHDYDAVRAFKGNLEIPLRNKE